MYGELEGTLVSHILLSQKPDPKEKQVINLDQDVHVCGYFWWMVYELLFHGPSLSLISFSWIWATFVFLSFSFFFLDLHVSNSPSFFLMLS
jgi:hypothetical protein